MQLLLILTGVGVHTASRGEEPWYHILHNLLQVFQSWSQLAGAGYHAGLLRAGRGEYMSSWSNLASCHYNIIHREELLSRIGGFLTGTM